MDKISWLYYVAGVRFSQLLLLVDAHGSRLDPEHFEMARTFLLTAIERLIECRPAYLGELKRAHAIVTEWEPLSSSSVKVVLDELKKVRNRLVVSANQHREDPNWVKAFVLGTRMAAIHESWIALLIKAPKLSGQLPKEDWQHVFKEILQLTKELKWNFSDLVQPDVTLRPTLLIYFPDEHHTAWAAINAAILLTEISAGKTLRDPYKQPRVQLEADTNTVIFDAIAHPLDYVVFRVFAAIVEKKGLWISGKQIVNALKGLINRADRPINDLPPPLGKLIGHGGPKGYRFIDPDVE